MSELADRLDDGANDVIARRAGRIAFGLARIAGAVSFAIARTA